MRWEEARYQDPTLRLAGGAAEYAKAARREGGREGGRVTPTKCLQPRGTRGRGGGRRGRSEEGGLARAGTGSTREGGRREEGKEARRRQGARQPGFAALVVVAQSAGYSNN